MWRAAVLAGRSLADLSTAALCALIVAVTGLVIGWRPDASLPAVIGGFALFLLFSYALSWGCGCLGIVSKGPESAQGVGLVILFPLAIVSNGLVPTQQMPAAVNASNSEKMDSRITYSQSGTPGTPDEVTSETTSPRTIGAWKVHAAIRHTLEGSTVNGTA